VIDWNWVRETFVGPVAGRAIAIAVGILFVTLAVRFARRGINRYVDDADSRYRARKLVGLAGYAVLAFYITLVFRDRLSGVTLTFGIIGAGIAFALQEVFTSAAGWVAITFGRMFKVGDRIEVSGVKGDVIDVSLIRTTLVELGNWVQGDLYSGRLVRVANSAVFKSPVFNYSADFPFLWDELTLPVRYGSDRSLARSILLRAANEVVGSYVPEAVQTWNAMINRYRVVPASVEPLVSLVANDNWMEFTLRYVVDYRARRRTRDALFDRILDDVEASEGKVSLASATFELVGPARANLKTAPKE
jgi:small-conductance mechanosensitive channel